MKVVRKQPIFGERILGYLDGPTIMSSFINKRVAGKTHREMNGERSDKLEENSGAL